MCNMDKGHVWILFLVVAQVLAETENDLQPTLKCYLSGSCIETRDSPPITGSDLDLGRLPYWLIPYHYNIELQPYFYEGTPPFHFDGSVEIFVDCVEATDTIYLNSIDMTIIEEKLEITVTEDSPVQPDPPEWISYEIDAARQFFIIYLDRELTVDAKYKIAVSYNGTLRSQSDGIGLYWASYESETEIRYFVSSNFLSSVTTRHAIPCFDESYFKATFDTTLVRKSGWKSLSNMPINHQESRGNDWVADVYDRTVVMSDYLLCFTICDFLFVQSISPRGHVTRIWTKPHLIYAAEFALAIAPVLLEWFEDYTGIPYPLPKLDHIALPHNVGAVENYGLITYGEHAIIFDPEISTTEDKVYNTAIIAHEIAHMWWGNLVTCYWWDDLWLNEALTTHFSYLPLEAVFGWRSADIQLIRTQNLMLRDEQNTSIPVRIEIDSPWEAYTSFQDFAYGKGAAVVRGIMRIMGEDSFQRAMQRYLMRHAYETVRTDDLWVALNEQAAEDGITDTDGSPLNFKEKFDPWLEQRGFPRVTITRNTEGAAELNQELFLNPQDQNMPSSPYEYKWNVPIAFYTEEDPIFNTSTKEWMDRENVIISDGVPENQNSWMIVNTNQEYYFSTNYDEASRADIVRQLRSDHESIAVLNRAHLIYDAFRQARAKYHRETVGMDMTSYIHGEDDFAPWKTASSALSYAALMLLRFPTTYDKFENYMNGQVDRIYHQIGWVHEEEDSAVLNQLLRGVILRLACTYGTPECITEAVAQYDQWQQDIDLNPVHPDNRLTVYCTAVGAGDQSDWEFAHSAYLFYEEWRVHKQADALLTAMACTSDESLLQTYLNYTFDEGQIRPGDASSALDALAESANGRWIVWAHLKTNWLDNATPPGVSKHDLFLTVVSGFATDDDVLEVDSFIATYPPEDELDLSTYDEATAIVQDNNEWADENITDLDDWFDEHIPLLRLVDKPNGRSRNGHHLGQLYDRSVYSLYWDVGI